MDKVQLKYHQIHQIEHNQFYMDLIQQILFVIHPNSIESHSMPCHEQEQNLHIIFLMLKENLHHLVLVDSFLHLDNVLNVLYNQIHVKIDRNLNFHFLLDDNETKVNRLQNVLLQV